MLNLLRRKPLVCFSLTFFVISCAAVYLPPLPKLLTGVLFLILSLAAALFGKRFFAGFYDTARLRLSFSVLFACAFAASALSFVSFDIRAERYAASAGQTDTVTLEITEINYTSSFGGQYCAIVRESEIFDSFPGTFRILLNTGDTSCIPGDMMSGTIRYRALEEDTGGYNEKRHALSRKLMTAADAESLTYEGHSSTFSLSRFFSGLNDALCRRIFRYTGEEEGGLAAALLLGNRRHLTDTVKRDFRRLGMYHMLSLSGAHLAILTTLSEQILLKMRIQKKLRVAVSSVSVLLFMALTGFSPSLTRAGIMLLIANLAYFIRRTPDYPTSLTFSCALILAANPFAAADYGLHLSFAAAHSCYISSMVSRSFAARFMIRKHTRFRKVRKLYNRAVRYLAGTAVFNVIISVYIMPLTWLYFGEMSLLSLPANLIYMPLITILMYLTLVLLLLSPFRIPAALTAEAVTGLTAFIAESGEKLSALRGIMLPLNYRFTVVFVIPLVILSALAFSGVRQTIRKSGRISLCIFALFLVTVGLYSVYDRNTTSLEYIADRKNDGFLVKSRGQLLICEISDGSYAFASQLTSHRFDLNCTEIEAYLLTHYHTRHISALEKLTDNCIVRTLILPDPVTETDTSVYTEILQMAEEKNIGIILTDRTEGDTVYFNDAEAETYAYTLLSRSAHPVTALRLSLGDTVYLYLGGSANEGDERILNHISGADCLIFGGHSPVYKTPFDEKTAFDSGFFPESKTVYVSEAVLDDLEILNPGFTEAVSSTVPFIPEKVTVHGK